MKLSDIHREMQRSGRLPLEVIIRPETLAEVWADSREGIVMAALICLAQQIDVGNVVCGDVVRISGSYRPYVCSARLRERFPCPTVEQLLRAIQPLDSTTKIDTR